MQAFADLLRATFVWEPRLVPWFNMLRMKQEQLNPLAKQETNKCYFET